MSTVHIDIVDGNRANFTFNGWEFNRIAKVSGLTTDGFNRLVEALLSPGMPQMNDSHPSISDAYVVNLQPESQSASVAVVDITYRQFTPNIQINISQRSETEDRVSYVSDQATGDLELMTLGYEFPADYPFKTKGRGEEGTDEFVDIELSVRKSRTDFVYQRTEWLTTAADGGAIGLPLTGVIVLERCRAWQDSLNLSPWSLFPNDPAKVWKVNITAQSSLNGFDWRFTYSFKFDPEFWEYEAIYRDPATNQLVPDSSDTVPLAAPSRRNFAQYRTKNFNDLGIF